MKPEARKIQAILAQAYPGAHCELLFKNPFELLIATILSAQSTDQKVNQVTQSLFREYPTAGKMSQMPVRELEDKIRIIGLFRGKAKNILATCKLLEEKYQGNVPRTMEDLLQLPGVGRKTAGVVLANAFGIPEFPADTHVLRVSRRLGLTLKNNPLLAEKDLKALFPESEWIILHHRLIAHGRRICLARKPECGNCTLAQLCPTWKNSCV